MAVSGERITLGTLPLQLPRTVHEDQHAFVQKRLTEVFERAEEIPFDDASRLVFFSDCHRGNNSHMDAFARNENTFLHALTHYYREAFTYIEVGDGDELWENWRFSDIQQAHRRTFDLLHRFDRQGRLHLIFGNHDVQGGPRDRVDKDGIIAREGLILRHSRTGQRILVVHGHQVTFRNAQAYLVSQFVVRQILRRLQRLGCTSPISWHDDVQKRSPIDQGIAKWVRIQQHKIEQRIGAWIQKHRHIVICGHTHRPMYAGYGALPYFNTGSCLNPGYITGIEIQDGEILPVRWSVRRRTGRGTSPRILRERIAPPRKLHLLAA